MATVTSAKSGLWSASGTWNTGVPADDDIVVIAAGHTVEFDVDQSSAVTFPNGIQGITITGTLKLTKTAGTYYLKIKAAKTITGAGTFDCTDNDAAIPFTAKHTITGGAGWYINGASGLTVKVYGTEPTYKYAKLSAAEDAGQTVLSIDTDLTGDIWQAGDTVYICNINKERQVESRIIAAGGIAANELTITSGLTDSKLQGSWVILATRHIRFVAVTANMIQNFFTGGKIVVNGGEYTSTSTSYSIFTTIVKQHFYNGVFHNCSYGVASAQGCVLHYGVFVSSTAGFCASGGTILDGIFVGCGNPIAYTSNTTICGGTFEGNSTAIMQIGGVVLTGGSFKYNTYVGQYASIISNGKAVFSNNSYDMRAVFGTFHNQKFQSTEFLNWDYLEQTMLTESFNHDEVSGAYKCWSKGGITASIASPATTGHTQSNAMTLASATDYGWWRSRIVVPAGKTVTITSWLRKNALMAYLPRTWVYKFGDEPFYDATSIIKEFVMTDSVDTWESDVYKYTNATAFDVEIAVAVVGKNASDIVYGAIDFNLDTGVSRSRVLGGVG